METQTIVVGGGQAGLSVGYQLARRGLEFTILDAAERVGDSWRHRWDSLRLFTPARFDSLAGMPFPATRHSFPTKDEMADYLEAYAERFSLPVRSGVRVEHLAREGDAFVLRSGEDKYRADNVIVAMSSFQRPRILADAAALDPQIVQLHSSDYRGPQQLREGGVLIVGAGNSGAEIALDVARSHPVWLSGREVGEIPFRVEGRAGRLLVPLVLRGLFHRVLTTRTPIGRRKRPEMIAHGHALVRTKASDLDAAGVERVRRLGGVSDGRPRLEDGRVLDASNVIWCTGYRPDLDWIDLPGLDHEDPDTERGIVATEPGLYFVGLMYLYSVSSTMIHGLARDAEHVARHLAAHRVDRRAASVSSSWVASAVPAGSGDASRPRSR